MGTRLRIGVVGLGSIAQKAWLPVLGAAESWTLQAAWSPGKEKALRICETGGCHTLIPSMPGGTVRCGLCPYLDGFTL